MRAELLYTFTWEYHCARWWCAMCFGHLDVLFCASVWILLVLRVIVPAFDLLLYIISFRGSQLAARNIWDGYESVCRAQRST